MSNRRVKEGEYQYSRSLQNSPQHDKAEGKMYKTRGEKKSPEGEHKIIVSSANIKVVSEGIDSEEWIQSPKINTPQRKRSAANKSRESSYGRSSQLYSRSEDPHNRKSNVLSSLGGGLEHTYTADKKDYHVTDHQFAKKEREVNKLIYFSENLLQIQRKKEEIIQLLLEENRSLYAKNKTLLAQNTKQKGCIKKLKSELQIVQDQCKMKIKSFQHQNVKTANPDSPSNRNRANQDSRDIPKGKSFSQKNLIENSANRKNILWNLSNKAELENLSLFYNDRGRSDMLKFDGLFKKGRIPDLLYLFSDPEAFKDRMILIPEVDIIEYQWSLKTILQDIKNLVSTIDRLKVLIAMQQGLDINSPLSDQIWIIIDCVCEVLKCDRSSLFLTDEKTGELWTKAARGSENTIRIPINKGIAGSVFMSGELINLEDAYQDDRFNQEVDKKMDYRTKSLLAVPVRDSTHNIIGVCQAINKFSGVFSPDDEYLFNVLTGQAGAVLKSGMELDQSLHLVNKLKTIAAIGSYLMAITKKEELLQSGERYLNDLFGTDKSKIFLVTNTRRGKAEKLIHYPKVGGEKIYPITGIAGGSVMRKEKLSIFNPYSNKEFNGSLDIDTTMPIIVWPIFPPKSDTRVMAVLQVINKMGIIGRNNIKIPLIDPIDSLILGHFVKLLSAILYRTLREENSNEYLNIEKAEEEKIDTKYPEFPMPSPLPETFVEENRFPPNKENEYEHKGSLEDSSYENKKPFISTKDAPNEIIVVGIESEEQAREIKQMSKQAELSKSHGDGGHEDERELSIDRILNEGKQ